MSLQFYNTLSQKKEKFNPISDQIVKIYTCGPTVYNTAHIGNFRTFLFEDLLKRFLIHKGYNVYHVMNITDIDDKTIKKAKRDKKLFHELTTKYLAQFMDDIEFLKIIPADVYPKATDNINEMIEMITKLQEDEVAYLSKDNSVYFNLSKDKGYGRLINLSNSKLKQTERVINDEYSKDNPQDFSLWKSWTNEDGDIFWDSPWGKGRPGWHIECSAMSIKYLGEHFDIHCGGVDNIFPHHENELAQSISATNNLFVNYWLHSEHLHLKGDKMSKAKGNFLTIPDLISKGFLPEEIRFVMLAAHYRTKLTFSLEQCSESRSALQRIYGLYNRLLKISNGNLEIFKFPSEYDNFILALDNDLDTPKAFAVFFKWLRSINTKLDKNQNMDNKDINGGIKFINVIDSIFGVLIKENFIPEEIHKLATDRAGYRKKGDWKAADRIRNKILDLGFLVEDGTDGPIIKPKK